MKTQSVSSLSINSTLEEPRKDKYEYGRLLAGFRKGQAPIPILGLDAPHPEKWISPADYDTLSPLEKDCLELYKGAFDPLT
jgi:hypothetical protein